MFASLKPWEERERSQMDVVDALRMQLFSLGGILAFPMNLPALTIGFTDAPVSLVVQGPDVADLARYADEIANRARAIPGLVNVRNDLVLNKPQIEVNIDRERASDLGVSAREIATTLQVLFGGLDLTSFKLRGETYDVIAQLTREGRSTQRDLFGAYVRGANDALIPLASVVTLSDAVTPRSIPQVRVPVSEMTDLGGAIHCITLGLFVDPPPG
jgi:multidrug efflux pump